MAYEVQYFGVPPSLISHGTALPAGHYIQNTQCLAIYRTASFPNSTQLPSIFSNVKIKRPDGTWANTVRVAGVHLRLPDGTWQIFT